MGIRDRLARLENRGSRPDFVVVRVEGGLPGPRPQTATAAGVRWEQGADEGLDAFEARVRAAAQAAGAPVLVLSGLPL